jgi:hypothetical protein
MSVALLGEPIGSSILAFSIPQIIVVSWAAQIPSVFTFIGGGIILVGIYLTARTVHERELLENV